MYARRRKFARRPRKYGRKSYRKGSKVSTGVRRYVKKIIRKNLENKEWLDYGTNGSIPCTSGGSTPSGLNLMPVLSQGTGDTGRIGNCVKIVKGTVNLRINLLPYAAITNIGAPPMLIKVFLLRNLASTASTSLASYNWNSFFKTNNGSSAFFNSPIDMDMPVNTDLWRVLGTRYLKLGTTSANATGPVTTGAYCDNSSFTGHVKFDWGKYCKKILKFQDSSSLPSNENIIVVIQAVLANGDATTLQGCELHWVNNVRYEDA